MVLRIRPRRSLPLLAGGTASRLQLFLSSSKTPVASREEPVSPPKTPGLAIAGSFSAPQEGALVFEADVCHQGPSSVLANSQYPVLVNEGCTPGWPGATQNRGPSPTPTLPTCFWMS